MKKSVLFIHHGNIIGGAPVSLSLQVKGITDNHQLEGTIAAHSKEMRLFFKKKGIKTIPWTYPCVYFGKIMIHWSKIKTCSAAVLFLKECLFFPFSVITQALLLSRREEPIVHLNSSVLFSSALAAKVAKKKIVWHIREASHIPKTVASIIYYLSDRVVCISPVEASRFADKKSKVCIVYNPVNFDLFNPEKYNKSKVRRELGIPEHANVVISLGGVNPRKGTEEIICGLKKCKTDIFAIIAGPPLQQESSDTYHKRISKICLDGIKSRIIFTGIIENPAQYVVASDLLIFIGKTPHFPRPVFEAWAAKKPVIVNEMEGISNNVDHGVNGIVISEPIDRTLAENLDILFADHDSLCKMGIEGYKKAVKYTSPDKSAKMLENIFLEIISLSGDKKL